MFRIKYVFDALGSSLFAPFVTAFAGSGSVTDTDLLFVLSFSGWLVYCSTDARSTFYASSPVPVLSSGSSQGNSLGMLTLTSSVSESDAV